MERNWFSLGEKFLESITSWPVLFFVVALMILKNTSKEDIKYALAALINNKNVKLKFGGNEISLEEFSSEISKDIDALQSEIDEKTQNAKLDHAKDIDETYTPQTTTIPGQGLSSAQTGDSSAVWAIIRRELADTAFKWRTVSLLAKRTALPEEEILRLLRSRPDEVTLSRGRRTGKPIARLSIYQ